jgi:HEAT repeat protein
MRSLSIRKPGDTVSVVRPERKKHILLTAVAIGFALVIILVSSGRESDGGPSYGGRPLSDWLARIDFSHYPDRTSPDFLQTSNAIVQIGTNGIPYLVDWINYKPARSTVAFWSAFESTINRLPLRKMLSSAADPFRSRVRRNFDRAGAAMVAFECLGPAARSAVKELSAIAHDPRNPKAALRATWALGYLGNDAYSTLLEIASSTNAPTRKSAIYGLMNMGTNAVSAVPMLVWELDNPDVFQTALVVLGELHLAPEVTVPALTKALQNPSWVARMRAAESPGAFGTNAARAIPALKSLLHDESPQLRESVSNALQLITTELSAAIVTE